MRIGETFRYSRPYSPKPEIIDGLPNYFAASFTQNASLPLLDAGINPIREINAVDCKRRPAILISSSPHRIGTETTPWQDFFNPDNGHIRYYGDNRKLKVDPENFWPEWFYLPVLALPQTASAAQSQGQSIYCKGVFLSHGYFIYLGRKVKTFFTA